MARSTRSGESSFHERLFAIISSDAMGEKVQSKQQSELSSGISKEAFGHGTYIWLKARAPYRFIISLPPISRRSYDISFLV